MKSKILKCKKVEFLLGVGIHGYHLRSLAMKAEGKFRREGTAEQQEVVQAVKAGMLEMAVQSAEVLGYENKALLQEKVANDHGFGLVSCTFDICQEIYILALKKGSTLLNVWMLFDVHSMQPELFFFPVEYS